MVRAVVAAVEIPSIGACFIEAPQNSYRLRPGLITPKCRVQRWNYESACTWDIFLLAAPGEMLDRLESTQAKQEYLDDVCAMCG
jgi:hypothetical protein